MRISPSNSNAVPSRYHCSLLLPGDAPICTEQHQQPNNLWGSPVLQREKLLQGPRLVSSQHLCRIHGDSPADPNVAAWQVHGFLPCDGQPVNHAVWEERQLFWQCPSPRTCACPPSQSTSTVHPYQPSKACLFMVPAHVRTQGPRGPCSLFLWGYYCRWQCFQAVARTTASMLEPRHLCHPLGELAGLLPSQAGQ